MAVADPGVEVVDSSDPEEDGSTDVARVGTSSHSISKNGSPTKHQNGSVMMVADRYGFIGGSQYTKPEEEYRIPIEKLRKRELKWLEMFENWEKWMSKRFRKEYLRRPSDPKCEEDIKKDLHRQFPQHEMFTSKGGYGQEDLYCILKAYTVHNPHDGYCQAQAPIAAVLLMHMPAEQAFWCLVSICEKYLPGYYSPGLEAVQVDGDVLFGLLKKTQPTVHKHLKKQQIAPILYMTEWFMCLFTRTLPWACVLRVWDMFFCEGVKVMFRVGLVLFRLVFGDGGKLAQCPTLYETLEKIRKLPLHQLDEENIVQETLRLNINERDMEKEHQKQIQRRKPKEKKKSTKHKS